MEEETADRLYRHFQTVDRNARQRRGLGFASQDGDAGDDEGAAAVHDAYRAQREANAVRDKLKMYAERKKLGLPPRDEPARSPSPSQDRGRQSPDYAVGGRARGSPDYAVGGRARGSPDYAVGGRAGGSPDYAMGGRARGTLENRAGAPGRRGTQGAGPDKGASPSRPLEHRDGRGQAGVPSGGQGRAGGGGSGRERVRAAMEAQLRAAEREGRGRRRQEERSGAGWTRFVFDSSAPLQEEQEELAGRAEDEGAVGALFGAPGASRGVRARAGDDAAHAAAIFGEAGIARGDSAGAVAAPQVAEVPGADAALGVLASGAAEAVASKASWREKLAQRKGRGGMT